MLIKNANVVSTSGISRLDIFVDGEKIKKVGRNLNSLSEETLDATGLYAFFGATDIHVHFRVPGGENKEDFYTGSCSAIAGGVTAFLDMPNTSPPTTTESRLKSKIEKAACTSVCDFGFHFGATDYNINEVKKVSPTSIKIYMSSSTGNMGISERGIKRHFQTFPSKKPICIHAEDQQLINKYSNAKNIKRHEQIRNPLVAASAVCKAISFAFPLKRKIHFCHCSTETEITLAKTYPFSTVEVAPHHLFLSHKDIKRLGFLKNVNPPLRSSEDVAYLWNSLSYVDVIASDHAPHTIEDKKEGASGFPGVQTTFPLLLDAAVKGRLRLEDVARLLCETPPRLFGLKERGKICAGNIADIVLVDLSAQHTITSESLFSKCGWSPYEKMRLSGKIVRVIRRGEIVFEDGQLFAKKGTGRLIMC
ncbi:MAG: dihydroorotase family protein [Candidatus Anstonellales archaeon]